MKISLKKFVLGFILIAGVFQFTTNSILGSEVGFVPADGNWYPGENSPIAWKSTMSSIIYPLKFVLVEPLAFLAQDPDGAPPVILLSYALYWSMIAVVLYFAVFLIKKVIVWKKV